MKEWLQRNGLRRPVACFAVLLFLLMVTPTAPLFPHLNLIGLGTPSEGSGKVASGPPPGSQWGSSMTYDGADGYMVMVQGGTNPNDTWAYSDGVWSRLPFSGIAPSPRSWACLTYDWGDGDVVLFGGGVGGVASPNAWMDDTWTYKGGVWANITNPVDSPPPLLYASCSYDSAPGAGYVLLFGGALSRGPGYTGTSGPTVRSSDQTWEFAGGRWTNVTSNDAPHPSARFGASMAYNSGESGVILYGGAVNGTSTANGSCSAAQCPHLNDTWLFSGGTWTNITATASVHGTPPGRWEASMANGSGSSIVIFGGQDNGYKSLNATGNYTWVFEGGAWANITSSLSVSPSTRFGAAIAYDPGSATVVMFGGLGGTVVNAPGRDDTWLFHDGAWTQSISGSGIPPSRPSFSSISLTSVTISWTQGVFANESAVVNNTVLVGPACGSWTEAQSTGGPATAYHLTGLTNATTYCVAIEMWNATEHLTGAPALFTTSGPSGIRWFGILTTIEWLAIGVGILAVVAGLLVLRSRRTKDGSRP